MMRLLERLAGVLAPPLATAATAVERHWMVCATVIMALAGAGFLGYLLTTTQLFWDFHIYAAAGRAWLAGDDPYNVVLMAERYGQTMPAVYSPLVLDAISRAQGVYDATVGRVLLVVVLVSSWIYLPLALIPRHERRDALHRAFYFAGYLALFGFAGAIGLASGNLSVVISAACIGCLRHWQRGGSSLWFWLALLVIGQIKFYYLAFLLFPVLMFRRLGATLAFLAVFALVSWANWLLFPQHMQDYLAQMQAFTGMPGSAAIGVSAYNFLFAALAEALALDTAQALALCGHVLMAGVLAAIAAVVVLGRDIGADDDILFAWLVLTVLLVSPRLLGYDLALGVVPFLVLLRVALRAGPTYITAALLPVVFSVCFSTVGESLGRWTTLFMLLGVWLSTALLLLRQPARPAAAGSGTMQS